MNIDKKENLYDLSLREQKTYQALWKLFARNSLEKDFRRSLYASLAMFLVPTAFNFYFIFKNPILKNSIRLSVIFSTVVIFQYYLNRDFEEFLKQDLRESNQARRLVQEISYHNILFPWFQQETIDVLSNDKIIQFMKEVEVWIKISKNKINWLNEFQQIINYN